MADEHHLNAEDLENIQHQLDTSQQRLEVKLDAVMSRLDTRGATVKAVVDEQLPVETSLNRWLGGIKWLIGLNIVLIGVLLLTWLW